MYIRLYVCCISWNIYHLILCPTMSGVIQHMASVTQLSVHILVLHGLLFETSHDITSALTLQWWQYMAQMKKINMLCKCRRYSSKNSSQISVKTAENYQYHKIFNISRTKSKNLSDCRLVLQLPLANPLKPGVELRMKMSLKQRWQAMLQLHLSDQQFYCQLRCGKIPKSFFLLL